MFIPELLPRAWRCRHRKTFFGDSRSRAFAILTPIRMIFDELGVGEPINTKGWWPCKFLKDALIILTPQGAPSIDALCSLEPRVKVIFVGLAGGLRDLAVGEIVEPSVAILAEHRYSRTSSSPMIYRDTTITTVNSLNESHQRRKLLRTQADCVDMETAWLFATAKRQKKEARAILIVSDHLFHKTFVAAPLTDLYPSIHRVVQELARMTRRPNGVEN
jgi:nucleoside phosphorylase